MVNLHRIITVHSGSVGRQWRAEARRRTRSVRSTRMWSPRHCAFSLFNETVYTKCVTILIYNDGVECGVNTATFPAVLPRLYSLMITPSLWARPQWPLSPRRRFGALPRPHSRRRLSQARPSARHLPFARAISNRRWSRGPDPDASEMDPDGSPRAALARG